MKSPLLILGALLCGSASCVQAQDTDRRFYLGLDLGEGEINRGFTEYSQGPGSNRRSTAWKLRFGWSLSQHWAFEAGFTDFGDYGARLPMLMLMLPGPADEPTVVAQGDVSTSAKGFDVSAISTWPIGETFYLNASIGLARREMRSVFSSLLPASPSFRTSDGDLAIQYGLGFGFRLNDAWEIGLNWATTSNLEGDFEFPVNQSDPRILSVGVRYRL